MGRRIGFTEDEAVVEKEIIISGGDYGFFFWKTKRS
jgi:hypothetical protein